MKLHLENTNAPWLRQAFALAARELGIEDAPWEVSIRLEPRDNMPEPAGGITSQDPSLPRHALIQIKEEGRDPLARSPGHYSMLEVLCHELVHIKQHIRDGLRGDIERMGTWWHGEFYPEAETEFMQMIDGPESTPWEEEAYAKMTPLATKIKSKIALAL